MKNVLGLLFVAFLAVGSITFYNYGMSMGKEFFAEKYKFAKEEGYSYTTIFRKTGSYPSNGGDSFVVDGLSKRIRVFYYDDRFDRIVENIPVDLCRQINATDVTAHVVVFLGDFPDGPERISAGLTPSTSKQSAKKECKITKFGSEQLSIVEMKSTPSSNHFRYLTTNDQFYKQARYHVRVKL